MKSTKIISSLSKEKKWDDLILFALSKETSRIFYSWISNKENEPYVEELIKSIPLNVYLLYL